VGENHRAPPCLEGPRLIVGTTRGVVCQECGHRYQASEGGGFFFHLLHCDRCGRERSIDFDELGDAHLRYVKGLPGPWTVGTMDADKHIEETYPAEALSEDEYRAIAEKAAGPCECGGRFSMKAPPRCPRCKSAGFLRSLISPECERVLRPTRVRAGDSPWFDAL
jgi:hypothetical protein